MKPQQMLDQHYANPTRRSIYANECRKCGACCVAFNQQPFGIGVDALTRVSAKLVQIGPWKSKPVTNRFIRITRLAQTRFASNLNKCAALVGRVGVDVVCSIYDSRPRCCVNFLPGSLACVGSREYLGMDEPEGLNHLGHS